MQVSYDIEKAFLWRAAARDDWEIHLYGADLPSYIVNGIELARGGVRTWSSLDNGSRLANEAGKKYSVCCGN